MRIVIFDGDVIEGKIEERAHCRIEAQLRQMPRLARELEARLLQVVQVEMRIPEGMDEIAGLQARGLRHHMREQRIGRDVEGFSHMLATFHTELLT
jgi:hypothetical protein